MDATGTEQGRNNGARTAQQSSTAARRSGSKQKTTKETKEPKVPKLQGKYTFIKPLVESQRAILGKTMAEKSQAMLKMVREIRSRTETCARFTGTYIDKHDVDPATGKGKEKSFIPSSLRRAMPLNFSKLVKNDSRCATALSAITTTMEKAQQAEDEAKKILAGFAKEIADAELAGRKAILTCIFNDTLLSLAEGLVKVGKAETKMPKPKNSEVHIAHHAVAEAFKKFDDAFWAALVEYGIAEKDDRDGRNAYFKNKYEKQHDLNYDEDVKPKFADNEVGLPHDDMDLVDWVCNKLVEYIPTLTYLFWAHDVKSEEDRKLDAELKELYGKKEVDEANRELADAMEVDEGEALASAIDKGIEKAHNKRVSKKKREIRKNSSGGAKNQASARTDDGQQPSSKSRRRHEKRSTQQPKRSSENYDDESSYESQGNYRGSSRRRQDEERNHNHRGREESRRPRSILRNRSVSWSRSVTPPRYHYSRDGPLRRDRRTTYRGSNDSRRESDKGGRGRGGRRN